MSPLRVVKVGGSLFDRSDLSQRLQDWTESQTPGINVFLAGGGVLADSVRAWDERFALGEERSHWLCIDLLDVTADLLSALLPGSQLCADLTTIREAQANDRTDRFVFAPASFLRHQEPTISGTKLPCSWQATSDSIAARLAEVLPADELVLLKSQLPKHNGEIKSIGDSYVDGHFLQAVRSLPRVRFVNLRDTGFPEATFNR